MKHKIKISISVAFLSLLTSCASSLVVQSDYVVWYAFTRFKRASDKYDQASVDSLIQEVLTNFN